MKIIYSDAHQSHDPPFEIYDGKQVPYAEVAQRAEAIIHSLRERQLGEVIDPRRFSLRHIYDIHQQSYVRFIRTHSAELKGDDTLFPSYYISDTYAPVGTGTYSASRAAVDCALTGAEVILGGESVSYSLCRPPGHHAAHHTMGGYCYFNNAAIAAHYLSTHGRVAILDIDFHHGNGTQDAFYDRSDVLYVSIHADPLQRYPYSSGFESETGRGNGVGYNHNFSLKLSTTSRQYLAVLEKALSVVTHFQPDYLVISAGFDTYADDPIGGFKLSADVYGELGTQINSLSLPTLIIQEGGYNVEHLGSLAANFLAGFNA